MSEGRIREVLLLRTPWGCCHRRSIALELEKQGWQINHIIDKDRVWLPKKH